MQVNDQTPSPLDPFVQSLVDAVKKPVDWDRFLQNYFDALEEVQQDRAYEFNGMTIWSPKGLYSPYESSSTRFLCNHLGSLGMDRPWGQSKVLEVGCGAGAISVLLALKGWRVTAADIDPLAVVSTLRNAANNGVMVRAYESDLMADVAGQFDAIVFNQPLFHKKGDVEQHELALSSSGSDLYVRFMHEAKSKLLPNGKVIVAYANYSDPNALHQPGWRMDLKALEYEGVTHTVRAIFEAQRTEVE